MTKQVRCPVCTSASMMQTMGPLDTRVFYDCPVCGRYEIAELSPFDGINLNHLASYLFYHRFFSTINSFEYRYHTTLGRDLCDQYRKEYDNGILTHGCPIHMDGKMVEDWYPQTLKKKADTILMYLIDHQKHIGQQYVFGMQAMLSLLFTDRFDYQGPQHSTYKKTVPRDKNDYLHQATYMLNYLKEERGLINYYGYGTTEEEALFLSVSPKGYEWIDSLQKQDVTASGDDAYAEISAFLQCRLRSTIFQRPDKELDVQNAIESLLIGRGMVKGIDYDRESGKIEFSGKEFIPDFVLPKPKACIEVKLLREGKKSSIIEEISADITAYKKQYERILFVVYDLGVIRDEVEFRHDIEMTDGVKVIVVKH